MIQTSYFANYRNFPDGKRKISISRFTPQWFDEDHNALELAPSKELLLETKDGLISDEEYEIRYKKETLDKLNPKEIARKYKDCIFLCYESSDDFCHRQLVSEWLNKNGILVEEVKNSISLYIQIDGDINPIYFETIMDRFLSNYKNVDSIVSDNKEVISYFSEKKIEVSLINDYNIALIFKKNSDFVKFDTTIDKIYIINMENEKITIQK